MNKSSFDTTENGLTAKNLLLMACYLLYAVVSLLILGGTVAILMRRTSQFDYLGRSTHVIRRSHGPSLMRFKTRQRLLKKTHPAGVNPVTLTSQTSGPRRIVLIKGVVGSRALQAFVDGGSEVTLIGESYVPSDSICESDVSLSGLGAGTARVIGRAPLIVQLGGRKYATMAIVVPDHEVPVSQSSSLV